MSSKSERIAIALLQDGAVAAYLCLGFDEEVLDERKLLQLLTLHLPELHAGLAQVAELRVLELEKDVAGGTRRRLVPASPAIVSMPK